MAVTRQRVTGLIVGLIVAGTIIACDIPASTEITNASATEVDAACAALERAGYDYWKLDGLTTGGRTLEVAAAIHTDHPGPAATLSYCVGR